MRGERSLKERTLSSSGACDVIRGPGELVMKKKVSNLFKVSNRRPWVRGFTRHLIKGNAPGVNPARGIVQLMESFDLDQSLRDSVTGLVSALGGIDFASPNRPYVLGDDALGCLKDLKKWVKFYGASGKLDALRCIADTNLVSLDICQILGSFKEGQENDKVKWRMALNCRTFPHFILID
jgi:hypothetical protein